MPQVRPLDIVIDDRLETYAAVVEPVERGGRVLLNLVVALRPVELQRIVDTQKLPSDWVATVLDDHATVVARHPGGADYIGITATADLRERMMASNEGFFESVSLDGNRTFGYFSTSSHGWTYLTAMPRARLFGAQWRAIVQVGLGSMLLLGLAMLGALWVSRRIVGPVCELKELAGRLKAGQPITFRPTGLAECDEVARSLAAASETLRHSRNTLEQQVADAIEHTRLAEQRASQGQRVEALGRLTGGVAHDFNNLLGVISNSAHLIQRHPASSELQVPLAATMRAVDAGSKLTQHLLRFSGRRPVRPQRLELRRYLPEVQEMLRSVVLGRHVEIAVHVAPGTEPVRVDSAELELALINLALNARDAMPKGGEIRLQACNAKDQDTEGLAGHPERRYVLITFSDDGVGIAPEWVDRVFEPFFTSKGVGKGTGLGLSQVHGFCAQVGGAARVASTLGLGTTVSLLIPADDGTVEPNETRPLTSAVPGISDARVLLVDDNVELGRVTEALLQSHGAQVHRVTDAAQALRQLETQPAFDVVLSDIVMPGPMDGLELARKLKRERPDLPVVLTSGYSHAASRATDVVVLHKPCAIEELLRALHDAMATGRTPAASERSAASPQTPA